MSKELDEVKKENEELESITKEMAELKARQKAIKEAQKKREKANKKYSDMQYALEDKYKELEKTIKGTTRYDDLLKEIAEMEVQVDEIREELGKEKYVYDQLVKAGSNAEASSKATTSEASTEKGLTQEDLIKLQVYNVAFENYRLDRRMKEQAAKDAETKLRPAEKLVGNEYAAAIITDVLTKYGDKLTLTEGEKEAFLNGSAVDILKTISLQHVFERSGITLPETTEVTPEVSKEVLKDIRKEASVRIEENVDKKLKAGLEKAVAETKIDNREELYTYGMEQLQYALDASKMDSIMAMGFDAYFNQTSNDYVVVRKNEEGELIIEDTQHSEKTNDFKMPLTDAEKDIKEPVFKAAAKLQKEAIKESDETLTVDEQLAIIKKAALEVMDELDDFSIEDAPTKLDTAEYFQKEMEKFFEPDKSKKRGPLDKIIAKKELRDFMKTYEKKTGISLGKGKEEREQALRDEYTRHCLTIAQYEDAKQMYQVVNSYQAKQQALSEIHTYEELMASRKIIDKMGLSRTEITTDTRDMFPGIPVPEERIVLHKISFEELSALGYKETKLDDKPYSIAKSPEGETVKASEVKIVSNLDFVDDLFKDLELDLQLGNNEAKQQVAVYTKALTESADVYSDIIVAQDEAFHIDSTIADEFGPEVDPEDEFEEDPSDKPVKPIVKESDDLAKGAKAFTFASFDAKPKEETAEEEAEEANTTDMDEVRKAIEELNAKLGGDYVIKIEEVREATAENDEETEIE